MSRPCVTSDSLPVSQHHEQCPNLDGVPTRVNLQPLRNCCGHRASRSDFGGRYLEISEANSAGKPVRRAVSECRVIRPELPLNPAAAASVSALTQHQNLTCRIVKVVVMTRRKTDAFAAPKVSEVVVSMDRLEKEVAPHAQARITAAIHSAPPPLESYFKISPGEQFSSLHRASRVENRIALALLLFKIDRFASVIPTRPASSVREIPRSSMTRSR